MGGFFMAFASGTGRSVPVAFRNERGTRRLFAELRRTRRRGPAPPRSRRMLHKAGITPRRGHLDTVTKEPARSLLSEELCAQWLKELGQEAKRFRFEVAPNPCVGAAVVSEDRIIGRGYHEVYGQEHAEIRALAAARASGVPARSWDAIVVT